MIKQKSKKKKLQATKVSAPTKTIAELIATRDGGQIALSRGILISFYIPAT